MARYKFLATFSLEIGSRCFNIPDTVDDHGEEGGHGADERDGGRVVAIAASPPVDVEDVVQRNDSLQDQPQGQCQLETCLESSRNP